MESRRERKKRQTREAIAETALSLFAERGFDAVTIADVADAADVAVNTVFYHFKTKEDLFFGAFSPPVGALADRLQARSPGESPVACVQQMLTETFQQMEAPDTWPSRALHAGRFRAVLEASPALQARAAHLFRQWRYETLGAVAAAIAGPEGPDPLAHLVAGQLLALHDGVMCEAERCRRESLSGPEIVAAVRPAAERACEMLAAGLGDYGVR